MTRTEQTTVSWDCDGPACTESTNAPLGWVAIGAISAVDEAQLNRLHDKHFHSEACLIAYLNT